MQEHPAGKFIVLYGINNLGKSTQAQLLVERLKQEGKQAQYIKYPIYDLSPSGPLLNEYLRHDNPNNLSPREAQLIYTLNRTQYEPVLTTLLQKGIYIVAEDYTGTGIAWGMGTNVDKKFLIQTNSHLKKEDIVFFFDGERFIDAIEHTHKHETNDTLMNNVRHAHKELSNEYAWIHINANQEKQKIHESIWETLQKKKFI